jgi:hypothetical protein
MHPTEYTSFDDFLNPSEKTFRDAGNVGQPSNQAICIIKNEDLNMVEVNARTTASNHFGIELARQIARSNR